MLAASAIAISLLLLALHFSPHGMRKLAERRLAGHCRETRSLVLSYDDGPSKRLTPRILDLLAAAGVHATFFATGHSVAGNEAVLDRLVAEGHELGCHSQEHRNAWKTAPWRALRDLREGYATLARWIPANGLFRPPYGKLTLALFRELRRRGAPLGWWTVVSGDTADQRRSPEEVANDVIRAGGGVVLMHDFEREQERDDWVIEATRLLIEAARSESIAVVTIGKLHEGMRR